MAKLYSNSLLLLRRGYAVAAENVKVQAAATVMRKVADLSKTQGGGGMIQGAQKEVFWMRDPKTRNWIPESHFGEVDVADLRAKFLSNKEKS